jgi:hypothetical protein
MVFSSMRLFGFYAPLLFSFALSMQYKRFGHHFGRGSSQTKNYIQYTVSHLHGARCYGLVYG